MLIDIMRTKDRRSKVYFQLVSRLALFDLVASTAWFFVRTIEFEGTAAVGLDEDRARCRAHSFFVQLGFVAIFCKAALTVYYALVLVFGYREKVLRSVRYWLRGIPVSIGVALASASLPLGEVIPYACYINPVDMRPGIARSVVFVVLPIATAVLVASSCMLAVSCSVEYRKSKAEAKPASDDAEKDTMSHDKAECRANLQCLLYLMVLILTWPFLVAAAVNGAYLSERAYGFWIYVNMVIPLHGIGNFAVYMMPRLQRYLQRNRVCGRNRLADTTEHDAAIVNTQFQEEAAGDATIAKERVVVPELREEDEELDLDPSVAIAVEKPIVAFREAAHPSQDPQHIFMDEGLEGGGTVVPLPITMSSPQPETAEPEPIVEPYQETVVAVEEYFGEPSIPTEERLQANEPEVIVEEIDENESPKGASVAFAYAETSQEFQLTPQEGSNPPSKDAFEILKVTEDIVVAKGLVVSEQNEEDTKQVAASSSGKCS